MAITAEFEAFARELFSGLGRVTTRRMFGAGALYADDLLFALLDDEIVWIKADAQNEPAFLDAGSPKFAYTTKAGVTTEMGYRRLPDAALDDPDEAVRWGRSGVEAALRAQASRRAKSAKRVKPIPGA